MTDKVRTEDMNHLFEAVQTLKNPEECYRFFMDICTINELQAMSQRYAVAVMLTQGYTYCEIAEKTGASTATISRVNRSLHYGSDGYELVFERLGIRPIENIAED